MSELSLRPDGADCGPSCAGCATAAAIPAPVCARHRNRIPAGLIAGGILFAAGLLLRSLPGIPAAAANPVGTGLFLAAWMAAGRRVLSGAFRNLLRGRVVDELFLMSLASAGAIAIGEAAEAAAVMLFYTAGETLQERAVVRSRNAIRRTLDLRPLIARVLEDGSALERSPDSVVSGSVIEIRPGESVPLDGTVLSGRSQVDTSALTGEPVPVSVGPEDTVRSGEVNGDGLLRVRVDRPYEESAFSRMRLMLDRATARKSPTEQLLGRFAAVYTPLVMVLAVLAAALPPVISGTPFRQSLHGALVMLVISCPCALVISVPLAYVAGMGRAAKDRILLRGADILDAAARIATVVFDKTGTLTEGRFMVRSVHPAPGFDAETLVRTATSALSLSNHPVARSVCGYGTGPPVDAADEFHEVRGMGVIAVTGSRRVLAGSAALLRREGVAASDPPGPGTVVHIAVDGIEAGCILLSDALKKDAVTAVAGLRREGVGRIVMLTGDRRGRAGDIAASLGIDEVEAELLPEDKMRLLESVMASNRSSGRTVFVGDGLNDAAAIRRADIGISMGAGGADLAVESADVVCMNDDPSAVPLLIRIARRTRRIIVGNIVFALSVKTAFMVFGVFSGLPMWIAVIGDVGVALLAVLNSVRIFTAQPVRSIRGNKAA